MNEMAKCTWTGLDGQLVFDITINRDPSDGVPSVARIHCRRDPGSEEIVTIHETRPTPLDIRFRSGCRVRGSLEQRAHVHIDGVDNTGIFADIHFGLDEEAHFEGLMVACPSRAGSAPRPPHPTNPPDPPGPLAPFVENPTEPGSPLPIVAGEPDALFNYVYVRRWPRVSDEDLRFGFIQYGPSSPPSSSFYEDLIAARQQGRFAAEALAVRFIDGDPPYQGAFIASVGTLRGLLRELGELAGRIRRRSKGDGIALDVELQPLLTKYGESASYFTSADYRSELDRIWQSYFALVVTLGYDRALLEDLAQSLWLAHLVELALTRDDAGDLVIGALPTSQVAEVLAAKVLLPASVFPLPPAEGQANSRSRTRTAGWIEPYAIGDLQLVRQRLLRYVPGEIARIENVMRGERREVSRRQVQRRVEVQEQRSSDDQLLQSDDADARSSLLEETRKLVAEKAVSNNYSDFQTSYGPPTLATINGNWTKATTQGPNAGLEDITRFAREILNKTVSRIRHRVGLVRTTSTMNQVEDLVTSVIDNTSGRAGMQAVFRWLNKVYEASVVNYGNRLMIEFMIRRPAAGYIAQEATLSGERMARPVAPAQLGIRSFEDIEPSNYAQLGARYGVTQIEPPPLAQKYVAATLRGGQEQLIAVPSGYCAVSAHVGWVSSPPDLPAPVVLVGRQSFNAGASIAPLRPYGEDSAIPVSVMPVEISSSPPSEGQVLVNVEVECEPTARAMDEWRIAIYRTLMGGYQEQSSQYYREFGPGGASQAAARSPLANRQIEQRELEQACIRLLLEHMAELTGTADLDASSSPPSPAPWVVNEPRYVQFLNEAFEWTEMAYSFHVSPHAGIRARAGGPAPVEADDDPLFTSFLQAEQARILVPVEPGRVMAFLYAFSSGMLWDGADSLVPALAEDLALVNDLEHAEGHQPVTRELGRRWELVVPTSMQVLDESTLASPGIATFGGA